MRTIVNFNSSMSIIVSAAVILFYTALGGFYSVVYTDAFQMTTTAIGLVRAPLACSVLPRPLRELTQRFSRELGETHLQKYAMRNVYANDFNIFGGFMVNR